MVYVQKLPTILKTAFWWKPCHCMRFAVARGFGKLNKCFILVMVMGYLKPLQQCTTVHQIITSDCLKLCSYAYFTVEPCACRTHNTHISL